jgi:hypothetical protein
MEPRSKVVNRQPAGEFVSLCDDVKYRRESFGGIVQSGNRLTRYFNDTAAKIIECCKTGTLISEISARLHYDPTMDVFSLDAFLRELIDKGVVRADSHRRESAAKLYFTDVPSFPDTCLFMPLGVELEVTLKCFRKCAYCSYESSPGVVTEGELTADQWATVLARLESDGIFSVRFTGGDPFARAHFALAVAGYYRDFRGRCSDQPLKLREVLHNRAPSFFCNSCVLLHYTRDARCLLQRCSAGAAAHDVYLRRS